MPALCLCCAFKHAGGWGLGVEWRGRRKTRTRAWTEGRSRNNRRIKGRERGVERGRSRRWRDEKLDKDKETRVSN